MFVIKEIKQILVCDGCDKTIGQSDGRSVSLATCGGGGGSKITLPKEPLDLCYSCAKTLMTAVTGALKRCHDQKVTEKPKRNRRGE